MSARQLTHPKLASKHIPMRRCVLCRRSKPQTELIRFYKLQDGSWQLDSYHFGKQLKRLKLLESNKSTKPPGRGTWICIDNNCHNPKKLAYVFKKQALEIEEILKELDVKLAKIASLAKQETSHLESTGTSLRKEEELKEKSTKFHSGGMNV